jgi:hypothetical protein
LLIIIYMKIINNRYLQRAIIVTGLFLLNMNQSYSQSSSSVHFNGNEWIYFGPAIINVGKAVKVKIGDKEYSIVNDDENLKKVKSWLLGNYERRLNFSPDVPSLDAVEFLNSITIYSTNELKRENILLEIPLTKLSLGKSDKEFEDQFEKLKALLPKKEM